MATNALSAKTGSSLSYINKTLDISSSTIVEIQAVLRHMQLNWHGKIQSQHNQVQCFLLLCKNSEAGHADNTKSRILP